MKFRSTRSVLFLCLFTMSGIVQAEMFIYPSKGQIPAEEEKDKFECHQWAVKASGVDPQEVEASSRKAAELGAKGEYSAGRSLFGGGAIGAALGAIGGGIAGNAGKGAAIGSVVGGLGGLLTDRYKTHERHSYYEDQMASEKARLARYDQAWATCLKGRGYTVSGG